MVTVLEEFITEKHRRVTRFYGQKDSLQTMFISKCFLFTMGSVCRKAVHNGVGNVSLMTQRLKPSCGSG
jgi:hypothetical protein